MCNVNRTVFQSFMKRQSYPRESGISPLLPSLSAVGAFPSFTPDALPHVRVSGALMAGSFQALTAVSHLIHPGTPRSRALHAPDSPLAKEVHFRVSFCLTIASCLDRVSLYNHRGGVLELVTPHGLSPHILPTVD